MEYGYENIVDFLTMSIEDATIGERRWASVGEFVFRCEKRVGYVDGFRA